MSMRNSVQSESPLEFPENLVYACCGSLPYDKRPADLEAGVKYAMSVCIKKEDAELLLKEFRDGKTLQEIGSEYGGGKTREYMRQRRNGALQYLCESEKYSKIFSDGLKKYLKQKEKDNTGIAVGETTKQLAPEAVRIIEEYYPDNIFSKDNTPVVELGLSEHIVHVLVRNNILTAGHLKQLTKKQLMNFEKFGRRSVADIIACQAQL